MSVSMKDLDPAFRGAGQKEYPFYHHGFNRRHFCELSWLGYLKFKVVCTRDQDCSPGRGTRQNGLGILLSWDKTVGNSEVVEHLL